MTSPEALATAVRAGEHACSRVALAQDRERLTSAFIASALARRHKVVYLRDRPLGGLCDVGEGALTSGQLVVLLAHEVFAPDGAFDMDRMLAWAVQQRDAARAEGWEGLSLTGDMSTLHDTPGWERLAEYDRRLNESLGEDCTMLCQYDHRHFSTDIHAEVALQHRVDISPELECIGRTGCLAAALVAPGRTLRIAGELDFDCAAAVGDTIDAHFHGRLKLDLADVRFLDVAGLRALRGRTRQAITIVDASPPVLRLLALMGWDTDPAIEIVAGAES
jgi:ABC-type transporter Mla MlaB component